jgi:hypothetical protein
MWCVCVVVRVSARTPSASLARSVLAMGMKHSIRLFAEQISLPPVRCRESTHCRIALLAAWGEAERESSFSGHIPDKIVPNGGGIYTRQSGLGFAVDLHLQAPDFSKKLDVLGRGRWCKIRLGVGPGECSASASRKETGTRSRRGEKLICHAGVTLVTSC